MGTLYKKGIPFGGGVSGSAENVAYDETTNVKEAIDGVKESLAPCTERVFIQELTAQGDIVVEDISQYKYITISIASTSGYGGANVIPVEVISAWGADGTPWFSLTNGMNPSSGYYASFNYRIVGNTISVRNISRANDTITVTAAVSGIK